MTYLHPLLPLFLALLFLALLRNRLRLRENNPRLLVLAALALFLVSWPPLAWLASWSLEHRYTPVPFPAAEAEALVVLAGEVDLPRPEHPLPLVAYNTYLRCERAAWLYKNWRALPVLACGGAVPEYAAAMKQLLESQGVPASRIWTEEVSRSTFENALYAAVILRAKGIRRIALVTEAYHMLRAEKCFTKQGLAVVPAPGGFRSSRWGSGLDDLLPGSRAIAENEDVLHEWVGLLWYYLRGRI